MRKRILNEVLGKRHINETTSAYIKYDNLLRTIYIWLYDQYEVK